MWPPSDVNIKWNVALLTSYKHSLSKAKIKGIITNQDTDKRNHQTNKQNGILCQQRRKTTNHDTLILDLLRHLFPRRRFWDCHGASKYFLLPWNSLTTSQCGKYNPVTSSQCQRCSHEKCKKCTNLVKNEETGVRHPVCNCGRVGLVDGLWHGEVMGS